MPQIPEDEALSYEPQYFTGSQGRGKSRLNCNLTFGKGAHNDQFRTQTGWCPHVLNRSSLSDPRSKVSPKSLKQKVRVLL